MSKSISMSDLPRRVNKENTKINRPVLSMSQQIPDNAHKRFMKSLFKDNKLSISKQLHSVLPSQSWKGRRCFIVGGGTSLRGFDFSQLKGELVITVNRAFEFAPFSVLNLCQDARVFGFYENAEFKEGQEAKKRFEDYKGFKTWLNVQAFPFPEDIYQVGIVAESDFNFKSFANGIPPYSNSGLNALCLAACLGASEIYLLGFDCIGENGRTANFHSGYSSSNEDGCYKDFIKDFNVVASRIKAVTRVINLNPNSGIRCFEFMDIKDIKKIKRPILISFYTKDSGYKTEIKRLESSAIKFGYEYDFYEADDLGTWRKNIHDRIRILKHFLNKYKGRDILYIDADGEIAQYPELFDNFKDDVGIVKIDRSKYFKNWEEHFNNKTMGLYEYLGGTMYFKNNKRVLDMLNLWEELDKPMEFPLSQFMLKRALETSISKGLKVKELPDGYCQIFDIMYAAGDPIIEHFQASRRGVLHKRAE